MKLSKIASAFVVLGFVISPIVAKAGTRATGSKIYSATSTSGSRPSANVADQNHLQSGGGFGAGGGIGALGGIFAPLAASAGILFFALEYEDDQKTPQSPGTT